MQITNDNLTTLTAAYASALRKYLKHGSGSLQPARRLGEQAVSFGLETLDVTKIHEAALATLQGAESRRGMIKRAEIFFEESVTPIERTHRAAIKADARLNEANKRLRQRTADLPASKR